MYDQHQQAPKVKWARYKKRLLVFGGIVGVILVIYSFFMIKGIIEAPRDLGPDLVYIGKKDYGCNILDFFFLCDSPTSGYDYYFGTDMSIDQLASYFSKAHYIYNPAPDGVTEEYGYALLVYKPRDDSQEIYINYFDNLSAAISYSGNSLSNAHKAHVIRVTDSDYGPLRKALQDAQLLGR